ncbi:MAG: MATE family efflux transporter [Bdellovibrionales bacterium]|nr:MATE family efflux transporter [Bdellovibrionales bacterium]
MKSNLIQRWKTLFAIAWPLIIANSFWNLQLTIDRIFLGEYSTESLGAAMAVMGVFWVPMALLQQTSAYITTFVAQYFGSKQDHMIGPALWQSIYISIIGGLLFLLLMYIAEPLFSWMNHSPTLQDLEIRYFKTLCYTALPTALVAAVSGFFTGLGNTKTVIGINAVGLLVNAILDYFVISGRHGIPAYGIEGAGIATAIASYVSAAWGAVLILQAKFRKKYSIMNTYAWSFALAKRFLRYGLPSGLQWSLEGLAFTAFLILIGRFENGEAALASSGIAVTIMMLSVLPCLGVAQAVMVLVGQHLGNKKPELAEEASWSGVQLSAMYMLLMAASFVLAPHFYITWFKNESNLGLWTEVQAITPYLLMFVSIFTLFDSLNLNFSFALKGAGDTRFVSLMALIIPWPLMVIPTFLIRGQQGAVYWSWGFASLFVITQALIFYGRFLGGKWKHMSVIQ